VSRSPAPTSAPTSDTRERLIEVAIGLFVEHSFAGTSLQMIADAMGITKAAVYHHFRTRDDLLAAVLAPVLSQLRDAVEAAEALRTPHARAEYMLTSYAAIAVQNRALVGVLAADPGVIELLRNQPEAGDLINRQLRCFTDLQPGPAGRINASIAFSGLAGASRPTQDVVDGEQLQALLTQAGRRILGLRPPRRPAHNAARASSPPDAQREKAG
jgi:AcrR family transcriptional regulator